jgi:hypothetical protein
MDSNKLGRQKERRAKASSTTAKNYISGIPHIQERKQLDSKLQREIKDNF